MYYQLISMVSISNHESLDHRVILSRGIVSFTFLIYHYESYYRLIFTVLEFHKKSSCIRCMLSIISLGIDNIWAKNTFFDNAKVLKIIILPSKVGFLNHHIFKTWSVSSRTFLNFFQVQFFCHMNKICLISLLLL